MPDRREKVCITAEEIARAKISSIQVREGDPSIEKILHAIMVQLQDKFKQSSSTTDGGGKSFVKKVADTSPVQEGCDERLRQQLERLKQDFDQKKIVLIDEDSSPVQYRDALQSNKIAGKSWEEDIKPRLIDNDAALLKKAEAMPEGGQLIGIYSNGDLAIRQRSQEIMNARWSKDWNWDDKRNVDNYVLEMQEGKDGRSKYACTKDGVRVNQHWGELRLLAHSEAIAQEEGGWAKIVEILRAVKAEGYHVPKDNPDHEKKGLVAASEVVTGGHYVTSPDGKEPRDAILECEDNIDDDSYPYVVRFFPHNHSTSINYGSACSRSARYGAVLWLRG